MVIMQKISQQFKILQKNEPKNTYVKTSKRQKELRIKRFGAYKLQKQNKKICDYIVINPTKN